MPVTNLLPDDGAMAMDVGLEKDLVPDWVPDLAPESSLLQVPESMTSHLSILQVPDLLRVPESSRVMVPVEWRRGNHMFLDDLFRISSTPFLASSRIVQV